MNNIPCCVLQHCSWNHPQPDLSSRLKSRKSAPDHGPPFWFMNMRLFTCLHLKLWLLRLGWIYVSKQNNFILTIFTCSTVSPTWHSGLIWAKRAKMWKTGVTIMSWISVRYGKIFVSTFGSYLSPLIRFSDRQSVSGVVMRSLAHLLWFEV